MFAQLIGPVDAYSSLALVALFAMLTITVTTSIAKRRSRQVVANEFELAKIYQRSAAELEERNQQRKHEVALANIATNKDIEFQRIGQNMITSHTATGPRDEG